MMPCLSSPSLQRAAVSVSWLSPPLLQAHGWSPCPFLSPQLGSECERLHTPPSQSAPDSPSIQSESCVTLPGCSPPFPSDWPGGSDVGTGTMQEWWGFSQLVHVPGHITVYSSKCLSSFFLLLSITLSFCPYSHQLFLDGEDAVPCCLTVTPLTSDHNSLWVAVLRGKIDLRVGLFTDLQGITDHHRIIDQLWSKIWSTWRRAVIGK